MSPSTNEAGVDIQPKKIRDYTTKIFKEQLWFCGKVVGEIRGQIEINNTPIISQMNVGVLTEIGIQFSSKPVLAETGILSVKLKTGENEKKLVELL